MCRVLAGRLPLCVSQVESRLYIYVHILRDVRAHAAARYTLATSGFGLFVRGVTSGGKLVVPLCSARLDLSHYIIEDLRVPQVVVAPLFSFRAVN